MTKTIQGVVRGRTIELDEDPGLSEGEQVEVQVRIVTGHSGKPGDGFLRTEGALADDSEWDGIMEEVSRTRRTGQ